jgi:PPP family 3-phenylpropionic acid transporter
LHTGARAGISNQHGRGASAIQLSELHPQLPAGPAFAPRLALFYAACFVALGLQMPLFPLWLTAKGLDAQAIGLVLALPMMVRVVAAPVVTREADRRDAFRGVLVLLGILAAAFYGFLGVAAGALAIGAVYALAASAWSPVLALTDAYALRGLRARGLAYGPVRLWGSAAFIAASLASGALIDLVPARDLIWFVFASMVAAAAAAMALAPLEAAELPSVHRRNLLPRFPGFATVALGASLVQASHAVYYGFSTLDWRAAGLDGLTIGALWALGVVAEIALFAFSARLPARFDPTMLLLAGAGGAALRWAAMAFGPPGWMLPALQCLHGLSFGATHLGSVTYLARAAPPGTGATAQGGLAVVQGLAMAAAMSVSGLLYAGLGDRAYAVMAAIAAVGGAIAFMAYRSRPGA